MPQIEPLSPATRPTGALTHATHDQRGVQHAPKSRPKPPKPAQAHALVLHNDPLNALDFAAHTLTNVLDMTAKEAWRLVRLAHTQGQVVLWVGLQRGAESKARQLMAAGPDPIMSVFGAEPLNVQVRPMA
ncbi:MAG: ATP-dependent Clp protease adaptor ClpS [Algisphaera sp.]